MAQARYYQTEAENAIFDYWAAGGGNPLVDLATGTGKSVLLANVTKRVITNWPDMRLLMLVHVRELVAQNAQALLRNWREAPVGINSAGLGRRDTHSQILFASIQSVFRKPEALGPRDLVLIDEAHLVPKDGDGMYLRLIEGLQRMRPDLRIAGFTATPFRMDAGRLDQGDGRLFTETVYSYGIAQGIEDGYLSPLVARAGGAEIDVSGVGRRGGEFIAGELEKAADKDDIINAAADAMVERGHDRKAWIVFCTGIAHATHVRDALRARGVNTEVVHGELASGDRDRIIRDFKAGRIRALTNAQVLTTGFDAPQVDLVAFLRPTLSTGLYMQMIGRGTRVVYAPGHDLDTLEGRLAAIASGPKPNCLILDYSGNVKRHGPVDAVRVQRGDPRAPREEEEIKVKADDIRAKECPGCQSLVAIQAITCDHCGHEWPKMEKPKHEAKPDESIALLSKDAVEWIPVSDTSFFPHHKAGAPTSLRVEYLCGPTVYREWICIEHTGFAGDKARNWWVRMTGGTKPPASVDEAIRRIGEIKPVEAIKVRPSGRYQEVVARKLGEKPRMEYEIGQVLEDIPF